jgi:glutaredoxin
MTRNVAPCLRASLALCGIVVGLLPAPAFAQQQQVYRYVDPDGRVVYSDRAPPANAKGVEPKRVGGNFIESDTMSLAARQASERYPVTLYTFACGEICQNAEALLNRRGIPFSSVNVEEPAGAEQLKRLTGEMTAPVLQVGDKLVVRGYNESRWHAMLDEAGYPKTGSAAPRRAQPARSAAAPSASPPPAGSGAPPVAAPRSGTSSPPTPGGGYPKE